MLDHLGLRGALSDVTLEISSEQRAYLTAMTVGAFNVFGDIKLSISNFNETLNYGCMNATES